MNWIIGKPTALAAAFLSLGLLGTSARADLTITVQEDGGSIQTPVNITGSPTVNLSGSKTLVTTTDYRIQILGGKADETSSTVGLTTSILSEVLSSTTSIRRTTAASSTTHTLHIVITATGFTSPTAPPPISTDSQVSGTITQTSSSNTLNYQSFVAGNGLGVQSPAITAKDYKNDKSGFLSSLSAPFVITETLDITLNGRNDKLNFTTNTTLRQTIEHTQAVTPEPSTMALAGLGALGLIGYSLRRRNALGA